MKSLWFGLSMFLCVVALCGSTPGHADVNVSVSIGAPPPYAFPREPQVIAIPGTYVYLVPGIAVDILFYQGYWYRPHEGHWFRSRSYNGPWSYRKQVPGALIQLPPNYRVYREPPPEYRRVPYGQVKKNWQTWERSRYWEKDEYWRRGRDHEHEEHGHGQEKGHGHGQEGGHDEHGHGR